MKYPHFQARPPTDSKQRKHPMFDPIDHGLPEYEEESRSFINWVREWLGWNGARTAHPKECAQYIARKLNLLLPAMTEEQFALAEAKILTFTPDHRGSMGHEKYFAVLELADGAKQEAIIRAFPSGWADTTRFRQEQAVYHLNRLFEFANGFPATALRIYENKGHHFRGWVQEASGVIVEKGLTRLAEGRYGRGNDDAVSKLIRNDPFLHRQVEHAFVERFILGDTDPSSHNMILKPGNLVQNIDLDFGFHGHSIPHITSTPAYGVNHRLFNDFAEQRLSAELLEKLRLFLRRYDNGPGNAILSRLGLKSGEIHGLIHRTRWFVRNEMFPAFHYLSL